MLRMPEYFSMYTLLSVFSFPPLFVLHSHSLSLALSPSLPLPPLSSLLLQVSPEFPEESWSFPKNYQSLVKGNLAGMAAVDQARAAETVKNDY